ncbi:MAG: DUF1186 domain-containing protein [Gemmatimonadetes bacterium]|nr:DUF1186 domain-containing protein [Gemmatimonadota bacterium]
MDASAILHELTHDEAMPREALTAASEQRAELAPVFLEVIDGYLAESGAGRAKPSPLFYIFHLLGQWRERTAYRRLAALLRCPSHELDLVLGDAMTATAHRVMSCVFDGDPQPIFDIVLDPEADEYVRSGMCETVAMLALRGELEMAVATRFLRDAYEGIEPKARCYVWMGWQGAIAMLGLSELKDQVRTAFEREFIGMEWMEYEEFEQDLAVGVGRSGEPAWPDSPDQAPFGDIIEELSGWGHFTGGEELEAGEGEWTQFVGAFEGYGAEAPHVNALKNVGRNDPCPCGSGKKFKKCCLG